MKHKVNIITKGILNWILGRINIKTAAMGPPTIFPQTQPVKSPSLNSLFILYFVEGARFELALFRLNAYASPLGYPSMSLW